MASRSVCSAHHLLFGKRPNNVLNVHLITKIQAKLKKSGHYPGNFPPNARISEHTRIYPGNLGTLCNILFTTVMLQYVDTDWRNILSSLPGMFPSASWLLAVAQSLPPPDPPNQSEAIASFTVFTFRIICLVSLKPPPHRAQKLQSGRPADLSLESHLPPDHLATIWKQLNKSWYSLHTPGRWTEGQAVVTVGHLQAGSAGVFLVQTCPFLLFMKHKLNVPQLLLPRWWCGAITFTIHNICPCDLVHVPRHLPLQIFLLQLQLCDVGLIMVDHL